MISFDDPEKKDLNLWAISECHRKAKGVTYIKRNVIDS